MGRDNWPVHQGFWDSYRQNKVEVGASHGRIDCRKCVWVAPKLLVTYSLQFLKGGQTTD